MVTGQLCINSNCPIAFLGLFDFIDKEFFFFTVLFASSSFYLHYLSAKAYCHKFAHCFIIFDFYTKSVVFKLFWILMFQHLYPSEQPVCTL